MKAWKPWQIVLLVYLLTLNLAVFGILAFYLFNNLFSPASPVSGTVAAILVDTPIPEPIEFSVPTPAIEEEILEDTNDSADYIPPVNIPPASPPEESDSVISNPEQTDTSTPSPTSTNTPQPTSTPSPTNTSQPTATATQSPTSTPTSTASATSTATSTPSATSTSTATATSTPRPTNTVTQTSTPRPTATSTSTPTRTPQPSATPTRTATPQPTRTPTISPTPTSSSPPLATVEGLVSVVASTLSDTGTNLHLDQPSQTSASEPGVMDALTLTDGSIALSWSPMERAQQYRIYSDMGSGYGVFVFKAQTTQPSYNDEQLRSGMAYSYRLTRHEANQEVVLAQIRANSSANETVASKPEASTASIIAVPTALPSDAVLLGLVSDNNFTDDFNALTIIGELRNDSTVDVGQTDITVIFYDAAGAVIGKVNGETVLETLSPGEKSPFLIVLTRPSGFASYSIRAVGRPVPAAVKQGAQLSVVEVRRYEDEAGFFHIEGMIQNVGSTVAKRTKVVAIIYGRDHRVINVGFTSVNPPALNPGEKATYEVVFTYYPRYLTQQVIPFEE